MRGILRLWYWLRAFVGYPETWQRLGPISMLTSERQAVLEIRRHRAEGLDAYVGQCGACACRQIFVGPDGMDAATVDCERCGRLTVELHRVVIERGRIVTTWNS